MESEIEKLLDTLTGADATLLAYANKKIEELDTRRQTISKAIAELSVETISPQQYIYYDACCNPPASVSAVVQAAHRNGADREQKEH